MKIKLLIVYFFCFFQVILAQDYTHDFGNVSKEELLLQKYAKDPSAEAVVLFDIGESYFMPEREGFELVYNRKMKVKIFTKAGLEWAQMAIPLYISGTKQEIIDDIEGYVYNLENGEIKKTVLDSKNTFIEKSDANWNKMTFAMPDIKEGTVFEVSYQIRSPFLFNLRSWQFQNEIPVIYSKYTTKMIPFYEYVYIRHGNKKFDDFQSYTAKGLPIKYGNLEYQEKIYSFTMKDLPAFNDESFITSVNDYVSRIEFQLATVHRSDGTTEEIMTSWQRISDDMLSHESFGSYLTACRNKSKDLTDTLKKASRPPIEKAKIIDRFVKSNFNWDGNSSKYVNKSVKEFLKSKTGNCAEINLFLAGMLNSAGIDAYPVLLSTRMHGKLNKDFPLYNSFNYVIVMAQIDSLTILLDATEPWNKFTEIPTRCINDFGLIVKKKNANWVSLKSNSSSAITHNFELKSNSTNDSISISCKLIATGYQAANYRKDFTTSYNTLKINLLGNTTSPGDTLIALNLTIDDKPLEINFNTSNSLESVEDKIIISPFCNTTITENPLKMPTRNYPVDMIYRNSNIYNSTIEIPDGYQLLSKSENVNIDNNLVRITYTTDNQNKDKVLVSGVYEFKKDTYEISEYSELKRYFNKIVDKFNEKLIFVKK